MAKIGTLQAPGGQDSCPKIFKCGSGLSYGYSIKALKKKFLDLTIPGLHSGPVKIRLFRL